MTWFNPSVPNGIIVVYNVYSVSGLGRLLITTSSAPGSYVVLDLQPSTQYSFVVEVCTAAGCQSGALSTVTTLDSGRWMCVCVCVRVCVYVCVCVCVQTTHLHVYCGR